jgi:predicted nucleic acid-binding protein
MPERPPPIVCDATMVLNLGHRGGLGEVARLLSQERGLMVTPEVVREVTKSDPDFYLAFLSEHFTVVESLKNSPPNESKVDGGILGDGELSVIATCMDHPEWLAGIDELDGRKAAIKLNIPLFGTVGIIEHAAECGWMTEDEALMALRRLRSAGFRCPKVLANDDLADYVSRLK